MKWATLVFVAVAPAAQIVAIHAVNVRCTGQLQIEHLRAAQDEADAAKARVTGSFSGCWSRRPQPAAIAPSRSPQRIDEPTFCEHEGTTLRCY